MKFKFFAVLAALLVCACCTACTPKEAETSEPSQNSIEESVEESQKSSEESVEESQEGDSEASEDELQENSNPGPDDSNSDKNIADIDSGDSNTSNSEGIYDGEGNPVAAEDLPAVLQNEGEASADAKTASMEEDMSGYEIYYGTISEVTPDGFEVTGYEHRNFGNERIRFLVNDETKFEGEAGNFNDITAGDFVQVYHDNKMTRSIPPQCFAAKVTKSAEDMYVMNCEVVEAPVKNGDNYQVLVASLDDARNQSILTYSADTDVAVVGDLLVGTKITVLTSGIATMSLPPQVPVVQIAEYQE